MFRTLWEFYTLIEPILNMIITWGTAIGFVGTFFGAVYFGYGKVAEWLQRMFRRIRALLKDIGGPI